MLHSVRRVSTFFVLVALVLAGAAAAQHPTFETGWVEAVIGGAEHRAYTYATEVPENVTDGVTDERTLAVLQKVAGTVQHSASFKETPARMLGGMVLTPAAIHVALSTRTDHPEGASIGSLLVQFSLVPGTLELGPDEDVDVRFYPRGSSYDDYYALTLGTLALHSIEQVNDHTFAVVGSISGVLSHQSDYDVAHNPADTLEIEATFEVAQLVASDVVLKLVGAE